MTEGCQLINKDGIDDARLTLSPIKKFDLQLREQSSSLPDERAIIDDQKVDERADDQVALALEATQKQNHLS